METNHDFARSLSLLRRERGVSQRVAAKDLGISQALLSHYENGAREPGLAFVRKACDYYRVSADFLLGRSMSRNGATIDPEELYDASAEKGNVLLSAAVYKMFRHLDRAPGTQNEDFFSISPAHFLAGCTDADMIYAEADYLDALNEQVKDKGKDSFPPMQNNDLHDGYPQAYQSLLQIVHTTGERVNKALEGREKGKK